MALNLAAGDSPAAALGRRRAGRQGDETAMIGTVGQAEAFEFPILVGVYAATAMQQNSIRATLRGNNTGLTHR